LEPTGTKFKKFGMEWEIILQIKNIVGELIFYRCVSKDKPKYEFRDFKESELEGVEFY